MNAYLHNDSSQEDIISPEKQLAPKLPKLAASSSNIDQDPDNLEENKQLNDGDDIYKLPTGSDKTPSTES